MVSAVIVGEFYARTKARYSILLFAIASIAVSLAFAMSLPYLEDYTKYKENEASARLRSLTAQSALERRSLVDDAEEMSRRSRTSFARGSTAVAIP